MTSTVGPNARSSHWEVFCKKGFLKHFTKFTGKHQRWSLFFDKVTGLRSVTLLKKDSNTGVSL